MVLFPLVYVMFKRELSKNTVWSHNHNICLLVCVFVFWSTIDLCRVFFLHRSSVYISFRLRYSCFWWWVCKCKRITLHVWETVWLHHRSSYRKEVAYSEVVNQIGTKCKFCNFVCASMFIIGTYCELEWHTLCFVCMIYLLYLIVSVVSWIAPFNGRLV